MIACPSCKTPLARDATHCEDCVLAVRLEGGALVAVFPEIRAGEVLLSHDLSRSRPAGLKWGEFTLPNGVKGSQHAEGLLLELPAGKAFESSLVFARRRDSCVRGNFVALDASIGLQVVLRRENIGIASTQYAFVATPAERSARVIRVVSSNVKSLFTDLSGPRAAKLNPPGQGNDIELRALGATLEGRVFGERVLVMHDPVLGIGVPGVRIEAKGAPGRCLWRGIEVRAVA